MAGIGRTPLPVFIGGFFGLLFGVYLQLSKPLLSDFKKISGEVSSYQITDCPNQNSPECLEIWLTTETKPFYNSYPGDYKPFIKEDNYLNKKITLWYNSKREFYQISSNGVLVIKHVRFFYWNLILFAICLLFHFGAYYETKKKTTNIKTYWLMWDYAFYAIKPIMKHNRRTYNPDDVIDLSWPDSLFISKKEKERKIKNKVNSWVLLFKLCNLRSLSPEVCEWLNEFPQGVKFLESFTFYNKLLQSDGSKDKIIKVTDTIFDFLSSHMDTGREYYNDLGKLFKEKFPKEYRNFLIEMNKLR